MIGEEVRRAHLTEVTSSAHYPRWQLALPRMIPMAGLSVLDIGCGDGRDLLQPEFADALELHGIDVDAVSVTRGKQLYPKLRLEIASAEALPYPDRRFDTAMSRVSLPYTNIPTAMREAYRVLRPGGYFFLSMHDWTLQRGWLKDAIRDRSWKRAIDHAYILPASLLYNAFGLCVARPWNGRYETFQTLARMRKALKSAGFELEEVRRTRRHWIFESFKPL